MTVGDAKAKNTIVLTQSVLYYRLVRKRHSRVVLIEVRKQWRRPLPATPGCLLGQHWQLTTP